MTEPKAPFNPLSRIGFHKEPPPDSGRMILEREIPSDVALATPMIVRVSEFLAEEGLLAQDFKNKFQLCFEEALRNAVLHGNRSDFEKKVRVKVFQKESSWEVRVEDEGCGFCLDNVPDPLADDSIWGESGRGLHLMCHYMDLVNFYRGGRILVMTKFL